MKNAKLWLGVCVLVGSVALLWSIQNTNEQSQPEIKIGALLPLTGRFAELGEDMRNGMQLALDEINQNKDEKIQIVFEDSAGDPKTAVNAANKLLQTDRTPLVITGPGSSVNLAVAPLMEKAKTIFIAVSQTPKLNDAGEYIFRVHPDVDREIERITKLIYNQGYRKIGIIYDNSSDTQVTGGDQFKKLFTQLGGEVIADQGYDGKNTTDLRTELTIIKQKQPDALYFLAAEKIGGLAVKQTRELGMTQPIYSWSPMESPTFLKAAGQAAEGLIITAQPFSCTTGVWEMKNFCDKYRNKFNGRTPLSYGAYAYDLIYWVNKIKKNDATQTQIITELLKNKRSVHVSGTWMFDELGNVKDVDFQFGQVKNGEFVHLAK